MMVKWQVFVQVLASEMLMGFVMLCKRYYLTLYRLLLIEEVIELELPTALNLLSFKRRTGR
jgi:hypothetical protein